MLYEIGFIYLPKYETRRGAGNHNSRLDKSTFPSEVLTLSNAGK
jgi:hypothetical protein